MGTLLHLAKSPTIVNSTNKNKSQPTEEITDSFLSLAETNGRFNIGKLTGRTRNERKESKQLLEKFKKFLSDLKSEKCDKNDPKSIIEYKKKELLAYCIIWDEMTLLVRHHNGDMAYLGSTIKSYIESV